MRSFLLICFFVPFLLFSQTKEKFVKEKYLHFKAGCGANFLNTNLYKSLNESEYHVFTPDKSICYNPSIDIEFENHFSRYVGITLGVGFMQTRQRYHYIYYPPFNSFYTNKYEQDGLILSNIPHFNISPSFYFKNTRLYAGLGIYKYYYSFNPMSLGTFGWNLNNEGLAIYSNVGITQSFEMKTHRFTVTANYYGLTKVYDSGFQLSFGIAL